MVRSTCKKLLLVQVAGLSESLNIPGLRFHKIQTVFPAVTCPVQASMRTGLYPKDHGMIGNFRMLRELRKPLFWEQSAQLVSGERIWENFRREGGKVAILFWQQSLGEDADIVLSPAPIHKHHGGMIMDCHSRPAGLYERLKGELGPFKLHKYWGPLASSSVGDWIVDATLFLLEDEQNAPGLCLTYLPSLDYDLQRYRPEQSVKYSKALVAVSEQLNRIVKRARESGYEIVVYGDYHINTVGNAVFPNQALLREGLTSVRNVRGMLYPDLYNSRAFTVVDHQAGHVYISKPEDIPIVKNALKSLPGVAAVDSPEAFPEYRCGHANSGELIIVADSNHWLAYPWWHSKSEAPDYASHVDIHNKPGYDPCELFWGWPPGSVSRNTNKIGGSHGLIGSGNEIVYASTLDMDDEPHDIVELSLAVKHYLQQK